MKKLNYVVLCAVMAFSLVACGNNDVKQKEEPVHKQTQNLNEEDVSIGGQVQIPNPIVEFSSVEDAKKVVDFDFNAPSKILEQFEIKAVSIINNELVQITYNDGENEICYRISKGKEDISGDYNQYQTNSTFTVGDIEVSVRGTSDIVNVATWVKDGLSFAICVNAKNDDMEISTIQNMLESII